MYEASDTLVSGVGPFSSASDAEQYVFDNFFSDSEIATITNNVNAFGTVSGQGIEVTNKRDSVSAQITGNSDYPFYGLLVTKSNGDYVWTISITDGEFEFTSDNLDLPLPIIEDDAEASDETNVEYEWETESSIGDKSTVNTYRWEYKITNAKIGTTFHWAIVKGDSVEVDDETGEILTPNFDHTAPGVWSTTADGSGISSGF